jgi:hypothetical protein
MIGEGNYFIDKLRMVNESYGILTNLIDVPYIVAEESGCKQVCVMQWQLQLRLAKKG